MNAAAAARLKWDVAFEKYERAMHLYQSVLIHNKFADAIKLSPETVEHNRKRLVDAAVRLREVDAELCDQIAKELI
jgi:hypothetical protein